MMEDLTLDDLARIREWFTILASTGPSDLLTEEDHDLIDRITARYDELDELNNIDLDDCLGGACKL